jgi:hypothetical protein
MCPFVTFQVEFWSGSTGTAILDEDVVKDEKHVLFERAAEFFEPRQAAGVNAHGQWAQRWDNALPSTRRRTSSGILLFFAVLRAQGIYLQHGT